MKHEDMKLMKRIRRTAEKICFVVDFLHKTNFIVASFGFFASFCFICFMFWPIVYTLHPKT